MTIVREVLGVAFAGTVVARKLCCWKTSVNSTFYRTAHNILEDN